MTTAAILLPTLIFVYKNRPADVGRLPDGDPPETDAGPGEARPQESAPNPRRRVRDDRPSLTAAQAYRTSAFWLALAVQSLWGMIGTAIVFHLAGLLEARGVPEPGTTAALALGVFAVLMAAAQFVGGVVADRTAAGRLLCAFGVLAAAGLGTLLALGSPALAGHRLPTVWGFAALLGTAQGTLSAGMNVLWPRFFGTAALGAIRGTVQTFSGGGVRGRAGAGFAVAGRAGRGRTGADRVRRPAAGGGGGRPVPPPAAAGVSGGDVLPSPDRQGGVVQGGERRGVSPPCGRGERLKVRGAGREGKGARRKGRAGAGCGVRGAGHGRRAWLGPVLSPHAARPRPAAGFPAGAPAPRAPARLDPLRRGADRPREGPHLSLPELRGGAGVSYRLANAQVPVLRVGGADPPRGGRRRRGARSSTDARPVAGAARRGGASIRRHARGPVPQLRRDRAVPRHGNRHGMPLLRHAAAIGRRRAGEEPHRPGRRAALRGAGEDGRGKPRSVGRQPLVRPQRFSQARRDRQVQRRLPAVLDVRFPHPHPLRRPAGRTLLGDRQDRRPGAIRSENPGGIRRAAPSSDSSTTRWSSPATRCSGNWRTTSNPGRCRR